jgi:hypothetical protein
VIASSRAPPSRHFSFTPTRLNAMPAPDEQLNDET